jgi:hypothetical protein
MALPEGPEPTDETIAVDVVEVAAAKEGQAQPEESERREGTSRPGDISVHP